MNKSQPSAQYSGWFIAKIRHGPHPNEGRKTEDSNLGRLKMLQQQCPVFLACLF